MFSSLGSVAGRVSHNLSKEIWCWGWGWFEHLHKLWTLSGTYLGRRGYEEGLIPLIDVNHVIQA